MSDAPTDVPLLLSITGVGAYEVAIEAPGSVAQEEVETPPVTLTWRLDGDEVAAHWPEQQVLEGALQVTNGGDEPVDLRLEAATRNGEVVVDVDYVLAPAGLLAEQHPEAAYRLLQRLR